MSQTAKQTILFRKSRRRTSVFDVVNFAAMVLLALITLLPVWQVFCKGMSGLGPVVAGKVYFWPVEFQLSTVRYVLQKAEFLNGIRTTVITTIVGTLVAMTLTVTAAYPLSKVELVGRKLILYIFVFTMLFNAGMIPTYLAYRDMKLLNSIWALIFTGCFGASNMFIMKNYMEALPEAVEEAARIDGAGNVRILTQVILPMCTPVLATLALFYAVGFWNNYMAGILYITDPQLKPLQQYLYDLNQQMAASSEGVTNLADMASVEAAMNLNTESMQAATIMVSTVPIIILYPFLQRYFVKGITIGSVKG